MSRSKNILLGTWLLMVVVLLGIPGCNREDDLRSNKQEAVDPLLPRPAIKTTVTGMITDESGKPVAGAVVRMHSEAAITAADGMFYFANADVPGNRCIVTATREGYFAAIRAFKPVANGAIDTRLVLMERSITHTFQAQVGVNASLPDGSMVKIEPGSLLLPSGQSYSGNVNMSVRYLDPTGGNFGQLVPGGDMIARREDESTSILYSYGILRVEMWDDSNSKLQVVPGKVATLIMNIPEAQRSTAPATIPLWWFDEDEGHWQEEGAAIREGNTYIGTVGHFTDWNLDVPEEAATIIGRLIDCDDEPSWGRIEFGQITSDPQSSAFSDVNSGRFEQRVPANVQLTVVLTDPLIIGPLTKEGRGKVIIIVPPLAPGQVYDVGDVRVFPCPVDVIATFKTNPADFVHSVSFSTAIGNRGLMHPGSSLNVGLPPNTSVQMTVNTARGVFYQTTIQTTDEGGEINLGIIDLTRSFVGSKAAIKGVTLCHGILETQGQVRVTWNAEGGTATEYALPSEDGSFLLNAPLGTPVIIESVTPAGTWQRELTTSSEEGYTHDLGNIEMCDNPKIGETVFTMNGDGMQNSTVRLLSNENWRATNQAIWFSQDRATTISIYSTHQDILLKLVIPDQGTGQRDPNSGMLMASVQREVSSGMRYYQSGIIYGGQLSVNVTKYEAVGGAVEGTFSGTFIIIDDPDAPPVIITDGKFSALRYPDDLN